MKCWHCKTEVTRDHALRIAENKFALDWENWAGWRFSGRFLIAPGKAGRITPERLLGMLWEEQARWSLARKANYGAASRNDHTRGSPHRMVMLPPRERFDGLA